MPNVIENDQLADAPAGAAALDGAVAGSMFALVVRIKMNDTAAVRDALPNRIAPMAAQSPGFLTGYWTVKDDAGLAILIFPSEAAATSAMEWIRVRSARLPAMVTLVDVEVREVVAHL